MSTIAIDIGNSQIKIGYSGQFWESKSELFADTLKAIEINPSTALAIISSVNSISSSLVTTELAKQGITYQKVDELLSEQSLINLSLVSNAGQDRILGLFGALSKAKPPILVVDCGTAMTLNYLDYDMSFRGGAILPGLYTQLDSLNIRTDKINVETFNSDAKFPAINTQDAVSSGILLNLIGAIESAIKLIDEENLTIVFTGGYSQILYDLIKKEKKVVILENYLVCKGIFYLEETKETKQNG